MPITDIRNIALVGHAGTGKTTLAEALLFATGAIKRKGSISERNTVSDYLEDEKDRQGSIEASILHLDYNDKRINLVDCPGPADFISGVIEGLAAADTALIAVNANVGIEVMTRKLWGIVDARGLAKVLIVTRMDGEHAKFEAVVSQLKEVFGAAVTPLLIPVGSGASFRGVFNLLEDLAQAPAEVADQAGDFSSTLIESVVSADESVMERYLSDEKISAQELADCFTKAVMSGALVPVLCCAAEKDMGVKEVLHVLANLTPRPQEMARKVIKKAKEVVEEKNLDGDPKGPFYAQVFKSYRDPFVGKIAYIRVMNGSLKSGDTAFSTGQSKQEKFAHLLEVQGKETKEVGSVTTGSLFAISKIEHLHAGDTLSSEDAGFQLPPLSFPQPMFSLAIAGKTRKDEGKISEQLRHLAENDPTFRFDVDHQTKELLVHAIGQLHMDLMLARLKRNDVEVNTSPPRIPYRSTIADTAEIRYRHKKQSGGSGQFGEVQIRVEPNSGEGYEFLDEIVGGVIPHNFIPSVDKGIRKILAEGVWPGIPVVDVRVRLNDGKSHPVDSKDVAFQIAGRSAFKQAFEKAKPSLIEPIVHLEVVVPSKYMGDITGHLSGKRGRIQGMDQMGDLQVVKAQVPASEVQGYSGELKSITGGEGFYSMEFSHYEQVPSNLAQPVIKAAMARQHTEEE